jgi:hypothetical protein
MSPREVQGLQALAENHGGSLTINPETGLPEAGFLDKLLPTIIGAGISYFSGGTIDPMTAAAMVGGVETARTGDIGKGISAGLGAYGGATLTSGMTTAGSTAMANEAGMLAGNEAAAFGAAQLTDTGANIYSQAQLDALKRAAIDEGAMQQGMSELTGKTTTGELFSKGFDVAKKDPMAYLKANAKPLMYALGPAILAGESAQENMPKTTTGMIAPYTFDPYSGTYTAATPYRAAGGGLMGLANGGMAGYEDDEEGMATGGMGGMFNFAQQSEPVVRMAEGGVPGYAGANGSLVGGYKPTDTEIFNYFKTPGLSDSKIAQDMATFGVSAADIARATGTQNQQADYEKRFVNTLIAPGTDASEFLKATSAVGLQNQALANAMQNAGLSQGAQYALTHAIDDKGYTGGIVDASTGKPVDFYKQIGYTAGALPGDQGGLEGLYGNINYAATGLQGLINSGKMTVAQAQNAALAELERAKLSLKDVEAATGKKFGDLFTAKKKEDEKKTTGTGGTGGTDGTGGTGGTGTAPVYGTDGTGLGGNLSTVLGLPPGVSGGGNTYVNPNGTITTRPDFSLTTNQVRDAYTKGGGSLGYEPYTPKTIEEFDTKYGSRLTGGSKQSLDYLTGKTKYSPVPYTPTGEVMKPYSESVLGIPMASSKKMYLFDPATKTYKINPDYAIPTYDKDGKKSLNLTNQDVINYVKSPEFSNDDTFVSWMTANNLSPEQVAAATGMSIADVYKKIKKAKPVDAVVDTPVTGQNDGGGGGEANGGLMKLAGGGMSGQFNLGDYSDGGRLLRGPGDGVSDSIPASIGGKRPARLADGEFVVPARIVSELGNGSTEAGARKLYAMMDRIQKARRGTVGRGRVAKNSRSEKHLPA